MGPDEDAEGDGVDAVTVGVGTTVELGPTLGVADAGTDAEGSGTEAHDASSAIAAPRSALVGRATRFTLCRHARQAACCVDISGASAVQSADQCPRCGFTASGYEAGE
jgi:hypothetical protein